MPEHRTGTSEERRADVGLVALLLALAGAGWALTNERMAGMDAGPGSELGGLGWFAVSWVAMMAAMMLPAITPMVVTYGRRSTLPGATAAFAAGYSAVWAAAGLVAYAAIEGVRSLELDILGWDEAGRYIAAGALLGAGLYQLTTPKQACLRRCRDRRGFVREHWRRGRVGALRMGIEHGGFCVGCCWGLMAALFALGVMSLTWMALVATLSAAERLLPWNARLGVALGLVALAMGVALAPDHVPGLTVPSSSMEMQ